MEKLIELLNEYEKLNMCRTFIGYYEQEEEITGLYFSIKACELISKKFGFIKWLVDNDKIDEREIPIEDFYPERRLEYVLLMILAISDTPIADLISYLK